jgi:hypothetical protein
MRTSYTVYETDPTGRGDIGEGRFEAFGRVEPDREQHVGPGEGHDPAEDPQAPDTYRCDTPGGFAHLLMVFSARAGTWLWPNSSR